MSGWRRKALELFPERRPTIEGAHSVYDLFNDLTADLKRAYQGTSPDQTFLDRAYEFAAWCFEGHQNWDLRNAVAVGFYEHLPAISAAHRDFAKRLSPDAFTQLKPLFQQMLSRSDYEAFVAEVAQVNASSGPQN